MSPPPTSPLDSNGLQERVAYGKKMRNYRDISSRISAFIQKIKDQAQALLDGTVRKNDKQEHLKKLAVDDGMLRSRFEEVHGPSGLCNALLSTATALMEIRLAMTYGDYMAVNLSTLKGPAFNGFLWRQKSLDWLQLSKIIDEELGREANHRRVSELFGLGNADAPETPWLDHVEKAAKQLNIERKQLVFEIQQYAQRNQLAHSGIKGLIEECRFSELADQIVMDKALLKLVFRDRTTDLLLLRNTIGRIQNEWFRSCFQHKGKTNYALSDRALQRQERLEQRLAASGAS